MPLITDVMLEDLADVAGSTMSNVSQHLNRLRLGGIVGRRRQGKTVFYSIDDPSIDVLCTIVCSSIQDRARKLSA